MDDHAFCPFCGIIVGRCFSTQERLMNDGSYDWTMDAWIVGHNQKSPFVEKTWISGPANYRSAGMFHMVPGDHHNFGLHRENGTICRCGEMQVRTYTSGRSLCFPVHQQCFEKLFSGVLHQAQRNLDNTEDHGAWRNVNLDALYEVLAHFYLGGWPHALAIDYGPALNSVIMQQSYPVYPGERLDIATNPTLCESLIRSHTAPTLANSDSEIPRAQLILENVPRCSSSQKQLVDLPTDVLCDILLFLPHKSVQSLRQTCKALYQIPLNNWYWSKRIEIDFPFLGDWLYEQIQQRKTKCDWTEAYRQFDSWSDPRSRDVIPSLANLRRIWKLCDQLADEYFKRRGRYSAICENANGWHVFMRRMPIVAWPPSSNPRSFQMLLWDPQRFGSIKLNNVLVYFDDDHILSNICFRFEHSYAEINRHGKATYSYEFTLSEGETIKRLLLTLGEVRNNGRGGIIGINFRTAEGSNHCAGLTALSSSDHLWPKLTYQRLLKVTDTCKLIGLKGTIASGVVYELALVEQGLAEDVQDYTINRGADNYPGIQDWMWQTCTPGDHTLFSVLEVGKDRHGGTIGFEHIGADPSKQISRISGNNSLRGIEIEFTGAGNTVNSEAMGPARNGMKHLILDLERGERVTQIGVGDGVGNGLPGAIMFLTSLNRYPHTRLFYTDASTNFGSVLILGHFAIGYREHWYGSQSGDKITGMFGTWASPGYPGKLAGVGVMCNPSTDAVDDPLLIGLPAERKDSFGHCWEPNAPPPNWTENDSRLPTPWPFPTREEFKHRIVSWLDFTRECESMHLCFTCLAPQKLGRLPITGITMNYQDGTTATVGVVCQGKNLGPSLKNAEWVCSCGINNTLKCGCGPAWRTVVWRPHGVSVACVEIWTMERITGMQFTLSDGQKSPLWGTKRGSRLRRIRFGHNSARGLKLFLGPIETHADGAREMIISTMQALVEEGGD